MKERKLDVNIAGYLKVQLNKNGKRKWHLVHRLVAQHFDPDYNPANDVNHKDKNKKNNSIDNLESMTHWANCQHRDGESDNAQQVYLKYV